MICVSLAGLRYEECLDILAEERFAEIRIDRMDLTEEHIKKLFALPIRLIATCRKGHYNNIERAQLLKIAILAGASYVDIEVEEPADYIIDLVDFAHKNDCKVIISYHNFQDTPCLDELQKVVDNCFEYGADIAKIVTTVNTNQDRARIMSLYADNKKIVAFGMGEHGKITRIMAPLLGAEFTYAARKAGLEVAPGQMDKNLLAESIDMLRNI